MCFLLVNSGVEASGFRLETGRKQAAGSIASVEDVEWAWRGNEGGRRSGEHEVRLWIISLASSRSSDESCR